MTLKNPAKGQDNVWHDQNTDTPLQRTSEFFADRNMKYKQTYENFVSHQSCEGLNPFAIRVFLKFPQLMRSRTILMRSQPIINLNNNQSCANHVT
jgi:hypothetical protein